MLKIITAAAVVVITATACTTTAPEPSTSVDDLPTPVEVNENAPERTAHVARMAEDAAYMGRLAGADIRMTSEEEEAAFITLGREYCNQLDDLDPRTHADFVDYLLERDPDVVSRALFDAAEYAYCPEWS